MVHLGRLLGLGLAVLLILLPPASGMGDHGAGVARGRRQHSRQCGTWVDANCRGWSTSRPI